MSNSNRYKSSIINLRKFHNWIKRQILDDTTEYIRKNINTGKKIRLLDLAVGKGGDMRKWYDNRIFDVVGIDIMDSSINGRNGAKERYNEFKTETNDQNLNYEFHVFDLSDPSNIQKIDDVIGDRKFDIVSCQFAIHYFFKTNKTLETFLDITTRYMNNDAFLIGTTMDGDLVNQLFKNEIKVQNDLYYFEKMIQDTDTMYGLTYKVAMAQKPGENHYFSEQASIEYLVDIDELTKVAAKYDLIFCGKQPFKDWYDTYLIKHNNKQLGKLEQEFSFLNFSFAYKLSKN
jgi:mRNA (guanine-N7-)-methyltransferase